MRSTLQRLWEKWQYARQRHEVVKQKPLEVVKQKKSQRPKRHRKRWVLVGRELVDWHSLKRPTGAQQSRREKLPTVSGGAFEMNRRRH